MATATQHSKRAYKYAQSNIFHTLLSCVRQHKVMEEKPDLLQWMRYVMIFSGQWVFKSQSLPYRFLYKINVSWIYLYILEVHCTFLPTAAIWWKCKPNATEMINCYLRVIGCLSITIILKSKGREDVIKMIRDYEQNDFYKEDFMVRKIYMRYSYFMNLILKISICGGIIAVINWYILGVIIKVEVTEDCPLTQGLLLQIWYPFDVKSHMWVTRVVDVTIVVSVGVFLTYSKLLPMSMLVFVLAHIKIVQHHIKYLDDDAKQLQYETKMTIDEARFMVIKKIIKRHQKLFKMMAKVQSVIAVVVMIFYITEPVALATYLVSMLLADDDMLKIKVSLPFVVTVIQLYVFSQLATEIMEESKSIGDLLYNRTEWRKYKSRELTLLLIMIRRAQEHLAVKATIIGVTSLETFTKIMKACYTIQACFATVRKDT